MPTEGLRGKPPPAVPAAEPVDEAIPEGERLIDRPENSSLVPAQGLAGEGVALAPLSPPVVDEELSADPSWIRAPAARGDAARRPAAAGSCSAGGRHAREKAEVVVPPVESDVEGVNELAKVALRP